MSFKWKVNTAPYSNGKVLYLGKFAVGEVFWDSFTHDKNLRYGIKCRLPGVKPRFENKETEDDAMKQLEFIVEYWIKNAELEIKGDENEKK